MDIPKKDEQVHTFYGGVDTDTAPALMASNRARYMLNTRVFKSGTKGVITNLLGNLLIQNGFLPDGNNIGLGYGKNEEKGKLYYFNYNDQGYHAIYVYDIITGAITPVLQNLLDTNNIDILKFNPNFLIDHVDVISDVLLYWTDGYNKARKLNINKCIDKSSTGYGTVITDDFITAYKQCAVYAPTMQYYTDLSRNSNYMYGLQVKAAVRFYYDDNEISNWSDWSGVPLPPNESYLGQNSITFDNNCVLITVETGNRLVTKIEIGILLTTGQSDDNGNLPWQSCIVLKKNELLIADYSTYTYYFYNDGSYSGLDQLKVYRPFSFLPPNPKLQAFLKIALAYGNFTEGFETVIITGSVALSFNKFYLPAGTVSQLNNPSINIVLLSHTSHGGTFNSWFTSITEFTVGEDVVKGNVFTINSTGGNGAKQFVYTATIADSATTVASQIKAWLRTIDGVGTGIISNEETDIDGNVTWNFTIEAHEGKNLILFTGNVTPVNYSKLLDNGLSINTIKQGSVRKYAVVYEDDDGRTSLAYTTDSLLIKTPFQTDTILGQSVPIGLQQPVHTVSITNQPPIWAKYWRLVRTQGQQTFIQLLIQQVNTVTVANEPTYLDMIVGSLFTYQKIHPDTVLKYDFERGDRLRLISNESGDAPVPYLPFFETEILGYSIDTEEYVDAGITCDGTAEVLPDKAVDPNYVGKYIIIDNVQRLITGISGSKYVLDYPIQTNYVNGTTTAQKYPDYRFKDTRGIIRIKLPPAGYTVVNESLVEIYRPQSNIDNTSYQNFLDFQMKFEVANYGQANRAHRGNLQDQDGTSSSSLISTPAIVQVTNGDAYVRNRAMPSNNQDPNPQVIIDQICDPNFSDFYVSDFYNTGRVYPQDRGVGVVKFGSRFRYSNSYIQDTQINGLNDFDNQDRKDFNDQYGDAIKARLKNNYLYIFKSLKTCWSPVLQKIIVDNDGNQTLATSDQLLNDVIYSLWEGGIGNNAEGMVENANALYIPSANSGVFLRVAQDGSIPISSLYNYDTRARELLSMVNKYNLRIYGGFDRENDEATWTIPDFIQYIFNNKFSAGDWQTIVSAYTAGTTWAITQQPANSTAAIVGGQIQISNTTVVGNDLLKFQGTLPAGAGLTPVINFCFTVTQAPIRATSFRIRSSSAYCLLTNETPPPPPETSTFTVNNETAGWEIALVTATNHSNPSPANITNVLHGTSRSESCGNYPFDVYVKLISGPGNATLTINGVDFAVTSSGGSWSRFSVSPALLITLVDA